MSYVRLALGFALPAFVALVAGCHHPRHHGVETVRGPDGQSWKLAECERMDRRCYDIAQRVCPNGYYLAKNPVEASSSSEAKRETQAANENATAYEPKAGGGNVTTLPPQSKWSDDMYSRRSGKLLFRCAAYDDPHS